MFITRTKLQIVLLNKVERYCCVRVGFKVNKCSLRKMKNMKEITGEQWNFEDDYLNALAIIKMSNYVPRHSTDEEIIQSHSGTDVLVV